MAPGGGKGGALMARLDDFIVKELSKGGEVFFNNKSAVGFDNKDHLG